MRLALALFAPVLFTLSVLPAAAQDMKFDIAPTQSCLIEVGQEGDPRQCIGLAALACMDQPAGGTTMGMGYCFDGEWQWWDGQLNAIYQVLRRDMAESDRLYTPYVSQADALREMQRAWIAYRDTRCAFEVSVWQGGTGGGPAGTSCLMQVTAEQTLLLRGFDFGGG